MLTQKDEALDVNALSTNMVQKILHPPCIPVNPGNSKSGKLTRRGKPKGEMIHVPASVANR